MSFKPGDQVRIKKGQSISGCYWVNNMDSYVGEIKTITSQNSVGWNLEDAGGWTFIDEWLELVVQTQEFKVGDKVVIKSEHEGSCGTLEGLYYDYIQIQSMYSDGQLGRYQAYKNGKEYAACSECLYTHEIERYIEEEPAIQNITGDDSTTSHAGVPLSSIQVKQTPTVVTIVEDKITTEDYIPRYKTNTKYKPRAANIRKLMGLRNHKSRIAA